MNRPNKRQWFLILWVLALVAMSTWGAARMWHEGPVEAVVTSFALTVGGALTAVAAWPLTTLDGG